ncbi:MAG TPA: transcription factor FapR [Bacillota bacterium]|nr:transcription factor FapR [Bacillota bacterium]
MGKVLLSKHDRQLRLQECLRSNPFITDDELARVFGMSVQTIRLDRMELGIPEARARVKQAAEQNFTKVRSLSNKDLIGELMDLELNVAGLSLLEITQDMVLNRSGIARGHFLFAQANSLAVAVVDAPTALTGTAKVTFLRPVKLHERVIAKAIVKNIRGSRYHIQVTSRVEGEPVCKASLVVFGLNGEGESLDAGGS